MWRPSNWDKCPCDDCPEKMKDAWGYVCNIHCGKRSAWLNYEEGADDMIKAIRKQGYPIGGKE